MGRTPTLLTAMVLSMCLMCPPLPRGDCAAPAEPEEKGRDGGEPIPGFPPGVRLGMSVKEFRTARPRAKLCMGLTLDEGKVREMTRALREALRAMQPGAQPSRGPRTDEGKGGEAIPVLAAYTEGLEDHLGCLRGVCSCLFKAGKCTFISVRLSFSRGVLPEKRRFFLKSWLEHFGPGFRRAAADTRSRGVTILGPCLVWYTDWGLASLCVPPDLEAARPDEGRIHLDVVSPEQYRKARDPLGHDDFMLDQMFLDLICDGMPLNRWGHVQEKHLALFGCVDEVLRDLKSGNADGRKEEAPRVARLEGDQARPARSSRDEIIISVAPEGEGPKARLRIALDYIAAADVEELKALLTGLAKVPGATKRPVTVAVPEGTPHRCVKQCVNRIPWILNECGLLSPSFKLIRHEAMPSP